jgi:hypothetical protein
VTQGVPALAAARIDLQIKIEQVLPRSASYGTRFDLAQIYISQSENRQRLEKRSRLAFQTEDNAGLPPA